MTIANKRERTNRQHSSFPRSAPAALLIELILTVSSTERDALLIMLDTPDPAEAAARLGIGRQALAARLRRLRRHAARLSAGVGVDGTMRT